MNTTFQQHRGFRHRNGWIAGVVLLILLGGVALRHMRRASALPDVLRLDGFTMGTTYSIRVVLPSETRTEDIVSLDDAVKARLAEINARMSVWDSTSEVSRFNAHASRAPFLVSAECAALTERALGIARLSNGAFDPTVGPLVELWGFGPEGLSTPPAPERVKAIQALVGYSFLAVEGTELRKHREHVRLDLGGIAKGYGVDAVAQLLTEREWVNFLVEIGGDLYASGVNVHGDPWHIGIDRPSLSPSLERHIHASMRISGAGVATSGDYRIYREDPDGTRYAHIVDPRTGQPIRRPISSVTVWAPDAALADALATALFVMGPQEGLEWLSQAVPQAEALFLVEAGSAAFREYSTPGFKHRTGYSPVRDR